ncbi:hypothetical protein PHAVU_001G207800 [Phaseolus vulgaris]|uniref:Uncharacterized protein n=1 Tax=Phaseolus vulgaris TaxID=3885 RepID=V7D0D8_PHAVU|nr:hypothetical protein PHAVU_001G207800g [Phaseolus vulgaris]ESW35113.1 hypothetical protein PHAVU_001G207800g [Phaseolus vulgaris]
MASSFTTIKPFSSFAMLHFSHCLTIRRGYGAASKGVDLIKREMGGKSEEKKVCDEKVCNWWMPDSVTGYYKPSNINEIDPAELRAKLLPRKFKNPSS